MITDGTIFVAEGTDKIHIQVIQHFITVLVENIYGCSLADSDKKQLFLG